MKAFRIDVDGVTELDEELAQMLTNDVSWDCARFDDDHDTWVHDEGLSRKGLRFADIGARCNLTLPAYVLGVDGERSVAAKHDIETMRKRVQIHPPADQLTIPAIGFDIRQTDFGVLWPWRALVAFPGECRQATEFLMKLHPWTYRQPTVCPRFGNLFELPETIDDQVDAIIELIRSRGFEAVVMAADHEGMPLHAVFNEVGISVEFLDVHFPKDGYNDDPFDLEGEAGHEIAHLAKPELREHRLTWAIKKGERKA